MQDAELIRAARVAAVVLRNQQAELEDLMALRTKLTRGHLTQEDFANYINQRATAVYEAGQHIRADGDTEETLAVVLERLVEQYEKLAAGNDPLRHGMRLNIMLPVAGNPFLEGP